MVALPIELYRPILEPIHDRRTLFALLRTSRAFYAESSRILHTHPNLYFRHPDAQAKFLSHITHHPHLALLVRKLSIHITVRPPAPCGVVAQGTPDSSLNYFVRNTLDVVNWQADVVRDIEEHMWESYIAPLNALIHLRHLVITVDVDLPLPASHSATRYTGRTHSRIFNQTTFQLHSLVCSFQADAEMSAFIARQKELRYLEWNTDQQLPLLWSVHGGKFGPPELRDDVLPHMEYLSGNVLFTKNVLDAGRGARLRALQIHAVVMTSWGHAILQCMARLEILSIWGKTGYVFCSEHAVFFPELRKLECRIGRPGDEQTLIRALCQVPKLQVLKLHNSMQVPFYRDRELMDLVPRIFESTALWTAKRTTETKQSSLPPPLKRINLGLGTGAIIGASINFEGWTFDRATGKKNPKKEEVGWHSWTWSEISEQY